MTKGITIRGVRYTSQAEAARFWNVSPAHVCQAKKKGKLDTVGLKVAGIIGETGGRPQIQGPKLPKGTGSAAISVTIDDVWYESIKKAQVATGLRRGKLSILGKAEAAERKRKAKKEHKA